MLPLSFDIHGKYTTPAAAKAAAVRTVLLVLLTLASGLAQGGRVKLVTFYSEPADARILLSVSGNAPFVLGYAGQELPLDLKLFEGRKAVTLTFQREGYLDEVRTLQKEGSESHYFSTRDRYPDASQGPVRLAPRTDAGSRLIQLKLFASTHPQVLATAALMLGLGVAWAWKLSRRAQRVDVLEGQRAELDTSDRFVFKDLGPYRLLQRLGEGGMGAVYKAVPRETMEEKEAVAIKILDKGVSQDPESRKRFEREVLISKKLVHPNIVRLIDWGEQEGLLYMVMEILQGNPLYKYIPPEGMDLEQVERVFTLLARGLEEAHRQGVVHRDLKPGNIFLLDKGGLKILDFGIARGHNFTVATATGQAMGTPAYMAPEQLMGEVDPRSDQYAAGVLLFEMVTGVLPFKDPDPFVLAMQHVNRPAPRPSVLRKDLPIAVEEVILKMMAKSPEGRYENVEEAAAALRRALPGHR